MTPGRSQTTLGHKLTMISSEITMISYICKGNSSTEMFVLE